MASSDQNLNASTENKSLLSKAKDTLIGLKDSAMSKLFKYSDPNKFEIKGMSRSDFEATKVILESKLRLKGMKGMNTYPKFYEQSWSLWSQSSQYNVPLKQESSNTLNKEENLRNESTFNNSQALNTSYDQVKKEEWMQPPKEVLTKDVNLMELKDDKRDELKFNDSNEVHVLPTIKVQEAPKIIEREIEYEKPIEIKQTIVHKEKPIIVEKPIIKEKYEHYRDQTQHIKHHHKQVQEVNTTQDLGNNNNEQQLLENLRKEKLETYSNQSPIIEHEKEKKVLNTEIREQPTIVNSKQTVYEQPIEIEKKYIEKVKPVVNEHVLLNKEHRYEKLAPEKIVTDTQQINQGNEFYSKDNVGAGADTTTTTSKHVERKEKHEVGSTEQRAL